MNTPSHVVVNLFLLGKEESSRFYLPIILGSLLPDVAIFWFYFWAKFIGKIPESKIWSEVYFTDYWQNIFAIPNSIVLCLVGVAVCHYYQLTWLKIMFISMIIHCLFDLPVHHDDAHRHFVPLTNYRFKSPFSYWDIRHHAKWISLIELMLVNISSYFLYTQFNSWWAKSFVLFNVTIYVILYGRFFLPYFR